jgi:hypothetical protein
MKKWVGLAISLFLTVLTILVYDSFNHLKQAIPEKEKKGDYGISFTQSVEDEGKKAESNSYNILILKQFKEKLDAWLKSLNDQIERKDITRLEVRFLEVLRNILEWLNEKIDAKIKSWEEKKPEKKRMGGIMREALQKVKPFPGIG